MGSIIIFPLRESGDWKQESLSNEFCGDKNHLLQQIYEEETVPCNYHRY